MNANSTLKPQRGRPRQNDAKTRAEIQRDYRQRRALQEQVDFDMLPETRRVALVNAFNTALAGLETYADEDLKEGAQFTAEKILGELIERYKLKPRRPTSRRT